MKNGQKKILIFDDDEDILSICQYFLEESAWDVQVSTDCDDIVEKVAAFMPDVILMDNWIPQKGGIVATQEIKNKEDLAKIPIIYFSAHNNIKTLSESAGANAYLSKPFDLEDLERIISSVM